MIFFFLGGAVMLGVSIFIHELGHLVLGRMVGIKAEIFSIGYGKGIWKKKIGDTTWQLTAFPIGGYVKFYGDDFAERNPIPGGFYSAPPLLRMIPVLGGPLFNLILGFVLFFIVHSIAGSLVPRVFLWEELGKSSPAAMGGLQDGDLIVKLNDQPVRDFYDIKQIVAFSAGQPLKVEYEREGKILNTEIHPRVDESGVAFIGLRPPGERFLEVNYPTDVLWGYQISSLLGGHTRVPGTIKAYPFLQNGDVVLSVEGEEPHSIYELQRILGKHHGEEVQIRVRRQTMSWLSAWFTRDVDVKVPSYGEYRIMLTDIRDLKYDRGIPDQQLVSSVDEHLRALGDMSFEDLPPGSFEKMFEKYPESTTVSFSIGGKNYRGTVSVEKIGLLGFRARDRFEREYTDGYLTFSEKISAATEDTAKTVLLYPEFFERLFTGRMSFMDNARGPVAMFAIAGAVFKTGFQDYLKLFGSISIALMVMNLLPFPVLDGGHLVFFAYEAIAGKPVSIEIMESIYKVAFTILMGLGLWIMYRDIIFFIGM